MRYDDSFKEIERVGTNFFPNNYLFHDTKKGLDIFDISKNVKATIAWLEVKTLNQEKNNGSTG